ncbi:MAG TPA: transglutaminaseTgpA domain-containing protein [Mycobacteriales bacterium]|nr:transglutaminaseTgpA domain-containing protein [Mycobacteriales bacterium]
MAELRPGPQPSSLAGLRAATLAAVLCGHVAAVIAEVLPAIALGGSAALLVGAATAAERATPATAGRLRQAATAGALVLAIVMFPRALGTESDGGARGVLGPLLVGVSIAQALTWRTRRDLQGGLGCAAGLLVLGGSFAPDLLVGLPLVAGWWALLLAGVLAQRVRGFEGVDAVAQVRPVGSSTPSPPPRGPLLVATGLAAVLGLVAFLLIPAPVSAGLQSRLAAATGAGGAGSLRATYGARIFSADRVDLRLRGDLTDRPIATVPANSPDLWRATIYSRYDGTAWTKESRRLRRIPGPPYALTDALPAGPTRADRVELQARTEGTVWSPGRPVGLAFDQAATVFQDVSGGLRGFGSRGTGSSYRVTSEVLPTDPAVLRAATGPDVTGWRDLPPIPPRVTELARSLTASAPSRIDAVRAVEEHLAKSASYRTDSPVPAPGEDAVDRFLFVDRVGFCEQFAAAETVLLRAAGIPARFVAGLAYGAPPSGGNRLFREKDLHTWVEVFHPGIGWVASDPTAGAQRAEAATTSLRGRVVSAINAGLRAAQQAPGGRPGLALALLVATAVVALALRLRPRRVRPATPRPRLALSRTPGPALAAFLRLDERLGVRRRRPAESLGELRDRLGLGGEPAAALTVVEEECYGATPPARAGEAAAVLDRIWETGAAKVGR